MRDDFPVYVPATGGTDVETGDLQCAKFYSQEPGNMLRAIADWTEENDVLIENIVWRTDFVPVDPTRYHPDDDIMPVFAVFLYYYKELGPVDPNDPGPVRYLPWS